MDLKYRRILYIGFFIIFFIASPIVIFLAKGYRYNFTKGTIEKTGVLFLETKPEKSIIYLNKKLQKTNKFIRIKSLMPNEYYIEIKKPGYQTWHKNLIVKPGKTTFAQYIRLFKTQPEITNILNQNIILTSPKIDDEIALLYLKNKKIKLGIFNFSNLELKELVTLKYQPEKITLSPKKNFILLEYKSEYANSQWILNTQDKTLIDLKKITQEQVDNIKWDKNSDENLYFISSNGFEKINLNKQTKKLISPKSILDFYINDASILSGKDLYFLEKTEKNILLNKTNLNNLTQSETITTLPFSTYKFNSNSPSNILTLLDKNNDILYLINLKKKNETNKILIFPKTNFAHWQNEMLLFGNDYEFSSYDLKKEEKIQIVRLGEKITNPTWYPIVTHIIFSVNNDLKIIENVEKEKFLNTLLKNKNISKIFTTHETDKIYYLDKTGINSLEIQ